MTQDPTYGPDMFYSDITVPDPTTVLNAPLPRAWSAGGVIESVKRAVVEGVRDAFAATTMGNVDGSQFYIDIEYPIEVERYPGLWVQFSLTNVSNAGLGMETWTKDDDNNWGPIHECSFEGRITLTIAALSSKDRDRLADAVLAQLAFSRPPDLVLRDPRKDAKQMRGLITALDNNPYVSMTLNTDQVISGGETASNGVPWAPNVLLYENNFSVTCVGQFNMRFSQEGVYELAEIRPLPSRMADSVAYDPIQWVGLPPRR